MPETTDAAQRAQTDNPNYATPSNRPGVVADSVQGPSLLARFAATLYPPLVQGADTDDTPNPTPWEGGPGAEGPDYGASAATTGLEEPAAPDTRQVDRLPLDEACPVMLAASPGANVGVFTFTANMPPVRIAANRPDRRFLRLRRRSDAGNVYVGFNQSAANAGDTSCVLLTAGQVDPDLAYTGELWATADTVCTLEVVEVFNQP